MQLWFNVLYAVIISIVVLLGLSAFVVLLIVVCSVIEAIQNKINRRKK